MSCCFRDTTWLSHNEPGPGSGCATRDGFDRAHGPLGTIEACIASYSRRTIVLWKGTELMRGVQA